MKPKGRDRFNNGELDIVNKVPWGVRSFSMCPDIASETQRTGNDGDGTNKRVRFFPSRFRSRRLNNARENFSFRPIFSYRKVSAKVLAREKMLVAEKKRRGSLLSAAVELRLFREQYVRVLAFIRKCIEGVSNCRCTALFRSVPFFFFFFYFLPRRPAYPSRKTIADGKN